MDPPGRVITRDTTQLYQSEERQGKKRLNTTKNNMKPTNTSGSKTRRLEHSNTNESEENDLKE